VLWAFVANYPDPELTDQLRAIAMNLPWMEHRSKIITDFEKATKTVIPEWYKDRLT
jgi:hypothetical protein